MHPKELRIEDFTYHLPEEKIAQYPLEERDASKLLVWNRDNTIKQDNYYNLAEHLPSDTLLVFNATKVVNARLPFKKPTGGQIEVFCLEPHHSYADMQTAMTSTRSVLWECLVGGAAKWKEGVVLELSTDYNNLTLYAKLISKNVSSYTIELSWNIPETTFAEVLLHAGKVPLPPYMNRQAEVTDSERYQTIFAKNEGSVAAPTASLHFTDRLMSRLGNKGIAHTTLTLHVGAGTFVPVKSERMEDHPMHAEWIEIDIPILDSLISYANKQVIAAGTTALRTLESLYWIGYKLFNNIPINFAEIAVEQWDAYDYEVNLDTIKALESVKEYMINNKLSKLITRTRILIAPGFTFRVATGLITNFHQPNSTLLLLVSAITGNHWKDIYSYALDNDFRFLSYGDGSLLWIK